MSQEDDHRDRSGEHPDGPGDHGSPDSGNPHGSGEWAAPGQGAPTRPPGGGPSTGGPSHHDPGAYGTHPPNLAPPSQDPWQQHPGHAPRPGQEGAAPGYGTPQQGAPGYAPPGYGAPGYAPAGYGAPSGYGAPQGYGHPGQQGYGHRGHGQYGYGRPQAPKPGVVALRPMTLGDIFNGAFSYIRNNPNTTFVLALIVMAATALLSSVASTWFMNDYTTFLDEFMADPLAADPDAALFPFSPLALVLSYVGQLLVYVGGAILLGLLAAVVGMAVLGYKLTPRQAWGAVRGRVGAITGLALLKLGIQLVMGIALGAVLILAMLVGVIVGLESNGFAGFGVGFLVAVLGGLAVVGPFLWIWIRLYYAMPVVVLERLGPGQAMARSWRLSQQNWWRTLGYWLLAGLIVMAVSMVLSAPFSLVSGFLYGVDALWAPILAGTLTYVITVLAYALTQPFAAGVNTLLYIDLRMRREGLDLRLHQASQHGEAVGPEIYLPENRT